MIPSVVRGYLQPPQNPDECIFAKTTACLSSDLKRPITPCQYGGDPDCTQCGCMASVGLRRVGDYKLGGLVAAADDLQRVDSRSATASGPWSGTRPPNSGTPAASPPWVAPAALTLGSQRLTCGRTAPRPSRPERQSATGHGRLASCSLVRHVRMLVVGPALPSAGGWRGRRRRNGRARRRGQSSRPRRRAAAGTDRPAVRPGQSHDAADRRGRLRRSTATRRTPRLGPRP